MNKKAREYRQVVAWASRQDLMVTNYAWYEKRMAEVADMEGGRFTLSEIIKDQYGKHEEICGQCDSPEAVAQWLVYGKLVLNC